MAKDNAVIIGSDGRFFRSAWLPGRSIGGSVKWADEYPDAAMYTLAEADSVAVRLKDVGFKVSIVTDYGKDTEQEYSV